MDPTHEQVPAPVPQDVISRIAADISGLSPADGDVIRAGLRDWWLAAHRIDPVTLDDTSWDELDGLVSQAIEILVAAGALPWSMLHDPARHRIRFEATR